MKALTVFFISLMPFMLSCSYAGREKLFEVELCSYDLAPSRTVKIVHPRNWEMSIPLFLRVYDEKKEQFKTAVFSGTDPDGLEGICEKYTVMAVEGMDGAYVVFANQDKKMILSVFDYNSGLHYPKQKITEKEYEAVGRFFEQIKKHMGAEIRLKDYF